MDFLNKVKSIRFGKQGQIYIGGERLCKCLGITFFLYFFPVTRFGNNSNAFGYCGIENWKIFQMTLNSCFLNGLLQ